MQVLSPQNRTLAQQDRPFQQISELSDIPGERILFDRINGVRSESDLVSPELRGQSGQ